MKYFIKAILAFTLIVGVSMVYVIYKTFNKYTIKALSNLNIKYIIFALFLGFLYQTFDMLRIMSLSRALNVKYSIFYGYLISFINTFAATITPLHIGGEIASVYMLKRKGTHLHKTMSIVTMKTISGLSFFILAFPITAFYLLEKPKFGLNVLKIFIISLILGGILYKTLRIFYKSDILSHKTKLSIKYTLRRYIATLRLFLRAKKSSVFLAFLYSCMLYITFLLIAPILIRAFGKNVDILNTILRQLGLLYSIYMSPTPGGSGIGEIGGLAVFKPYLSKYELGIFVILWRFVSQYFAALIGFICFQVILIQDEKKL